MDIDALLDLHGSDKQSRNGYAPIYHAILKHLRDRPLAVLEVGIGTLVPGAPSSMQGHDLPGYRPGASLRAWRDWLTRASVCGIDVQPDCMLSGEERISTALCDSTDPAAVDAFIAARFPDDPAPIDLVVDDGSHADGDQLATLRNLWPRVRAGGFYVMEDVQPGSRLLSDLRGEAAAIIGDDGLVFAVAMPKAHVVVASRRIGGTATDLDRLFDRHGSDKDRNGYTPVYHAILKHLRNDRLSVLEVGIGTMIPGAPSSMVGYSLPGYRPGGSLRAWRDYLPNALVHGADVQPDTQFDDEERIRTHVCDSTDAAAAASLAPGLAFDLVVDDGSHAAGDQLATLRNFWPRVKPGGHYVVEDVHPGSRLLTDLWDRVKAIIGGDGLVFVTEKKNLVVVSRRLGSATTGQARAAAAGAGTTTFVTALMDLGEPRPEPAAAYLPRLGDLAATGVPLVAFVDPSLAAEAMEAVAGHPRARVVPATLDETEAHRILAAHPGLALPAERNAAKDTRAYLTLQNAKLDFVARALVEGLAQTRHVAWIDCGIMSLVRDRAAFAEDLRCLAPPPTCLLAPGFWPAQAEGQPLWQRICWRFAGGFLLGDAASVLALREAHLAALAEGAARGALTWEVNLWALMEARGHRFGWYAAEGHDGSLVRIPGLPARASRIALNMIVRNEAAVVRRCLEAAAPSIDCWAIADTGSTDGTPEIVEAFFAERGVPGVLRRTSFRDFSQARNEALDAAEDLSRERPFDYILLLDADMVLDGQVDRAALRADAYRLRQAAGGQSWLNTRLVRRGIGARYVGPTHEYLSVPGPEPAELDSPRIDDRGDGGSKADKTARDIRLLEQALRDDPRDARSMYYLARCYRDADRLHRAVELYGRRIAAGGWDEEVWSSMYERALCRLDMGDEPGFVAGCLEAYDFRPSRAEPLHRLARRYRETCRNEAATLFAEAGARIPLPADALFVEEHAYRRGFLEETSIAGFYCRSPDRRAAARRACAALTLHRDADARALARSNWTHYARSAAELLGAETREIAFRPGDGYAPMNPSVWCGPEGRFGVVRTVNYTVTDEGQYPTSDDSGIIRTRNHVARFDEGWNVVETWPMADATGLPRTSFPVEGFEDCRIFRHGDEWRCLATVRDFPGHPKGDGMCEQALLRLDGAWRVVGAAPIRDFESEKTQKNWMPMVGAPMCVYSLGPTVVLRLGPATEEACRHAAPGLADLRGGGQAVPLAGGGWLCLVHEVAWTPGRVYLHRLVLLDAGFRAIRASEPFWFLGRGIEFAAGLARDGDRLVASFGSRDASAHLAFFDEAAAVRALEPL
jgi:glycosyltransferase involved in cell wall biosynthesis/cephalosporin hydroxylase